jgi:hypothetical protein
MPTERYPGTIKVLTAEEVRARWAELGWGDPANARSMLQQEWRVSERDQRLAGIAARYHEQAEAYDREVCTGPVIDGAVWPATPRELALVNRNALGLLQQATREAAADGFTTIEVRRAISRSRPWLERR